MVEVCICTLDHSRGCSCAVLNRNNLHIPCQCDLCIIWPGASHFNNSHRILAMVSYKYIWTWLVYCGLTSITLYSDLHFCHSFNAVLIETVCFLLPTILALHDCAFLHSMHGDPSRWNENWWEVIPLTLCSMAKDLYIHIYMQLTTPLHIYAPHLATLSSLHPFTFQSIVPSSSIPHAWQCILCKISQSVLKYYSNWYSLCQNIDVRHVCDTAQNINNQTSLIMRVLWLRF